MHSNTHTQRHISPGTKSLSKIQAKYTTSRAIPLQEWSILLYLKYPLLHWQSATPSKSVHSEVSLSHSGSFCLHKLPTVRKRQPTSARLSLNPLLRTFAFPRHHIQVMGCFNIYFFLLNNICPVRRQPALRYGTFSCVSTVMCTGKSRGRIINVSAEAKRELKRENLGWLKLKNIHL